MNPKSAFFKDSKSGEESANKAVVPLISQDRSSGDIFFIGTAFYISGSGILITAKHHLFDKEGELFDNLGVYHFLPNDHYILRPIRKGVYSKESDIACCLPEQILHHGTDIVSSPSLVLTNELPEEGDQLCTYGYPDSRIAKIDEATIANFTSEFYLGTRGEFHSNGFSLLKNPCFQTTIKIKSGASGGPVFDKSGHVFAVSSTGFDLGNDEGENISFVTPILPSLITMALEDGAGNIYTVPELIKKGFISIGRT